MRILRVPCSRPARSGLGFVRPGCVVRVAFSAPVAGSCGSMSTPAWQGVALWHQEFSMSAHYDCGPGPAGEREGCQATRRSVIVGRCLRPPSNLGRSDVRTTVIYTHVLNRGPAGAPSPLDGL